MHEGGGGNQEVFEQAAITSHISLASVVRPLDTSFVCRELFFFLFRPRSFNYEAFWDIQ